MAEFQHEMPDEPASWTFKDAERSQALDACFAKVCSETDIVCEAFGPDAWGDMLHIEEVARELGELLNEMRHESRGSDEYMLASMSMGRLFAKYASAYIERYAEDRVEDELQRMIEL